MDFLGKWDKRFAVATADDGTPEYYIVITEEQEASERIMYEIWHICAANGHQVIDEHFLKEEGCIEYCRGGYNHSCSRETFVKNLQAMIWARDIMTRYMDEKYGF